MRCIDDWNRLPDCVLESDTVLSFKTQLDKFLSGRGFDLDRIYYPERKLKTLSNKNKKEVDKPFRTYTCQGLQSGYCRCKYVYIKSNSDPYCIFFFFFRCLNTDARFTFYFLSSFFFLLLLKHMTSLNEMLVI